MQLIAAADQRASTKTCSDPHEFALIHGLFHGLCCRSFSKSTFGIRHSTFLP